MGLQCLNGLSIASVMLGNEVAPLRANKPGAVLFIAHGRGPPGVSFRIRAGIPQSRRHSSAISASSRGICRTRAGHTAVNLEAQGLGSCLSIGRNSKVDEIGHANLHVSNLVRDFSGATIVVPETPISGRLHKESIWI